MAYGIYGLNNPGLRYVIEAWLLSYDPDYTDGRDYRTGMAKWTPDPEQALRFETKAEAYAYWHQQSKTRPLRPDGTPNRPLTAFSVLVQELPEARP